MSPFTFAQYTDALRWTLGTLQSERDAIDNEIARVESELARRGAVQEGQQ